MSETPSDKSILNADPNECDFTTANLQVAAFLLARGFTLKAIKAEPWGAGSPPWKTMGFPGGAEPAAETDFTGDACEARAILKGFRSIRASILDSPRR